MNKKFTCLLTGLLLLCGIGSFAQVTLSITPENVTADLDETVSLDVTVANFTDVMSAQFAIGWNETVLQFQSISNLNTNLPGLSTNNIGTPGQGGVGANRLFFSWNHPSFINTSLPNGAVLFTMNFKAIGNGNSAFNFVDDSPGIEIIDENGASKVDEDALLQSESTVTIGGGSGGGGGNTDCTFTGFGLKFSDVEAAQGEQICIDVTVQGFTDILGMQYTLNYDPAVLQFQSITNTNLAGLTAGGNFGNPIAGKVTVFWFDQSVAGVTLPDETRIYSVCFTVLQETATNITLVDSPTAIDFIVKGPNEESLPIAYNICGGAVNGGGGTGGGDDCTLSGFGLSLGNVTAAQGTQACIEFKVQDFDLITGLQFTVNYDPTVLQYQTVSNIDLPDMTLGGNFGNPSAGKITVFWFHQATTGVTKADGSVIFSLCFNVLQTTGTALTLGDAPTPIDFIQFDGGSGVSISYDICPGSVNMVSNTAPAIADAVVTATSCNNTNNGGVALTVTGDGSYSYQWSRGSSTTGTITGLGAGPVSVTVTDTGNGLTTTGTYMITSPAAITVNANIVQVSCVGENNGSIVITASGGTGNLTYSWMPGGATTSSRNNLAPGSYGLTINDTKGCSTAFGPYLITEPAADISITETIVNVTCAADKTGSITVAVSGGTPNYRLNWSGTLLDNVLVQSGLAAGAYSLTVTDARNCSQIFQFTIASTNPAIQIAAVPVNIPEGSGGGAVNITATGGSGAFTYSWTGPAGFTATTEDLTGITNPGDYCLTVTDQAGCTEDICVKVGRELVISDFAITQPCNGGANGSINITVQGGVNPYTYKWTQNGMTGTLATTEDLSGISAGNYNVTVTDANNENITGSFEVTGSVLQIDAAVTPTAPGANSGAVELDIPGDAGSYTLSWSNGGTTSTISNLDLGEYCVTITFNGGCVFEDCYLVTDEAFTIVSLAGTNLNCAGTNNGSVSLQVKGGVKPYQLKMAGSDYTSNTGSFTVNGLAAGTFDLVISDAGGATETRQITINEPVPITYSAVVVHDTEDSGCTGSITLQLSGGTGPYTVSWNGQGLVGQQIIVCAFDYTALITDSRGCTTTTDLISVTTFTEAAQITDVSCPGEEDARIDLTVSGGNGAMPYTFAWREIPGGAVIATTEDLANVGEGTYYVEISEASGNKLSRNYTVKTTSGLKVQASVESDYNGFGVSCSDAADGTLSAIVTNPQGTVEYEWLRGGSVVGTAATLANAAGGAYTLRVIDDNCISEIPVTLPAPDELTIEVLNVKSVACVGERDGSIVVGATGGTAPYIYRWSNNDFGNEIDFLATGAYTVTVTDRNNCSAVSSITVGEPAALQVTVMSEPATNELGSACNGSVRAMVTGGQEPYRYKWVNISNRSENMITNLCPGEYIVEVTDALGCLPVQASGFVRDRTLPCFSARTVLTPNEDGLNDSFIIFCADEYPSNRLKVYNRWGELVYQKDNYDCTQNGGECFEGRRMNVNEPLPEGAYYWVLEYTDNATGEEVQLKGSLTILAD